MRRQKRKKLKWKDSQLNSEGGPGESRGYFENKQTINYKSSKVMENNQLPFEQAKAQAETAATQQTMQATIAEQPQPATAAILNDNQALAAVPHIPVFNDKLAFEHAQRVSKMLSTSSLVPKEYQNSIPNIMIALEMANRIGASPLMVMQNLNIIQGRPSWSSQFIISALNSCKRFSPVRFVCEGKDEEYGCFAWAYDQTGEKIEGPKVTLKMANAEGWVSKNGSKWKTMPELMLRYRAAAFFGRLYAPDVLMGMYTADEAEDIAGSEIANTEQRALQMNNALNALK